MCANSPPSHGAWSCRTQRKPGALGPAASELFMTHAGRLPSACLPPLPGRSLAVYWQSSGIKLARPLLFPHPHRPRRVHQGLALILILFKRGKSDSTVSSEAIYTPPLATAPTPFVWCAIKSINRKFLQGKPDCCSIRERHTAIHLHRRLWPAQLALILLPKKLIFKSTHCAHDMLSPAPNTIGQSQRVPAATWARGTGSPGFFTVPR